MTWKYAWRYHRRVFIETLSTSTFWWTLLGILVALMVWFYLFYLAIKYLDTSLAMYSTFCSTDEERNRHILIIVMSIPVFAMGLLGFIGEWMTIMDNRRAGRKNRFQPLIVFSSMFQLSALVILIALQC